jgi:hypothetical protein
MPAPSDSSSRALAGDELRGMVRSALRAGALTSVTGTSWYVAILVTSITFASTGPEAAGLRSLLVPLALLLGGVSMLFSVPAQIGAARGGRYPSGDSARSWIRWSVVVAATFAALSAVVMIALHTVARPLIIDFPDEAAAARFLALMPIGYILLGCSDLIEGFLRGSGRFKSASSLVLTRAAVISCGYALWVGPLGGDPLVLPWFYVAGGAATMIAGSIMVAFIAQPAITSSRVRMAPRNGPLVLRVGVPVLGSYVLLSSVVAIQIALVSVGLGENAEVAFSGMQTVQSLCVVAAMGVAVGVSSEVLRRATNEGLAASSVSAAIARTSTIIFLVEVILFGAFLAAMRPLLEMILVGAEVNGDITTGAVLLVLTSLIIANDVFVLTVLEEIGAALLSLGLNAVYFGALIAVTWAAAFNGSFSLLGGGLLALSVGGAVSLRFVLRIRARRPAPTTLLEVPS